MIRVARVTLPSHPSDINTIIDLLELLPFRVAHPFTVVRTSCIYTDFADSVGLHLRSNRRRLSESARARHRCDSVDSSFASYSAEDRLMKPGSSGRRAERPKLPPILPLLDANVSPGPTRSS